jgi:hypothetical protein
MTCGAVFNSCFIFWDLKPADCAAWAQAIGTILAILGAFAIAYKQGRTQSEVAVSSIRFERQQQRLATVEAIMALAKLTAAPFRVLATLNSAGKLQTLAMPGSPNSHFAPELRALQSRLDQIPLHELAPSIIAHVLTFSSIVRSAAIYAEQATHVAYASAERADAWKKFFTEALEGLVQVERALESEKSSIAAAGASNGQKEQ